MFKYQFLTGILTLSVLIASCQSQDSQQESAVESRVIADSLRSAFPYDLNNPVRSYDLPTALVEVSGMTCSQDSSILMVQDEIGVVFRLDLLSGRVDRYIKFAGHGDFEGITQQDSLIWVIRSDGKIHRFQNTPTDDAEDDKWKLGLPPGGDYEALTRFPGQNKLLVVGKEPVTFQDQGTEYERLFISFPANQPDSLSVEFVLDLRDVEAYLQVYASEEGTAALAERFAARKKKSCKPSGMAFHPLTGHLYVIASVGKILCVIDQTGQVLHVRSLTKDLFPQPEGLCFGPDGTLYISHEGIQDKARVHTFPMVRTP